MANEHVTLQHIIREIAKDLKFDGDTSKAQKSMRRDIRKRASDGKMSTHHDKHDRYSFRVTDAKASDYMFVAGVVRKHLTRVVSKANASVTS